MRVGWMRVDLMIHASHSLKEKRRPLKSLLERLGNRFNVSIAEVDYHDLHQRTAIGIAFVAADGDNLHGRMNAVKEFIYANPDFQVLDIRECDLGEGR